MEETPLAPESMDEIIELVVSGQKVAACKRYIELREEERNDRTSLLDAKEFIEELTDELRERYPERFANTSPGCLPAIIFGITLAGVGLGLASFS